MLRSVKIPRCHVSFLDRRPRRKYHYTVGLELIAVEEVRDFDGLSEEKSNALLKWLIVKIPFSFVVVHKHQRKLFLSIDSNLA